MRCAVIDLGSNTFHALVANVEDREVRSVILDDKIAVRLGEHAFARRRINDEAYARGFSALGELIDRVRREAIDRLAVVATGVFREACNGRRFLAEARGTYDVEIELLDGRDEARLTWDGVAIELGKPTRLGVLDLGGGSLECAVGNQLVESAHSLPLGMLRLRGFPASDVRAIVKMQARHVIEELATFGPEVVALSSGSARTLLRLARKLNRIPLVARHIPSRTFGELAAFVATLCPSALDELGVPAERRDTIGTAALVFDTLIQNINVRSIYVARAALREGVLASVTSSADRAFRAQCMP